MSLNRTAQVAAATAAVVIGALCIQGVAYASDHHSHHHGSYASDRDSHGDDGDDGDDGNDRHHGRDHDGNHLDIAGIDLGQVTDAVSDLLNSLGDAL